MTLWILYLTLGSQTLTFQYNFAYKETCVQIGRNMVQQYRYENYKCERK